MSSFPAFNTHAVPNAQGQSAAFNGSTLESRLAMFINGYGYNQLKKRSLGSDKPYYVSQLKETNNFLSIYGHAQKLDFFLFHPVKYKNGLVIECKHQSVSGSVDMKLPYTVLSLKALNIPSILLLDGNGASQHAIDWCANQQNDMFLFMRGFKEFQRAAQGGLL